VLPVLKIKLFGGFDLSYNDTPLTTAVSERLQSLLTYLVLNRHTPQTRQHLAFLFWADSNDAQSRTNLRRVIHDLRRILPDVEHFITIAPKTLQWKTDAPFTLDVMEFEQAITATDIITLKRAVDLYRGKLLPNCYDEWIEPEQERLQQACVQVYSRLIQQLLDRQDHKSAIHYGQQLLRIDPLNETGYFDLMRSYALSGDRSNALQTYHRCMTVLCDELGIDPSPATRNLYESLLNETDPDLMPLKRTQGDGEVRSGKVGKPSSPGPIPHTPQHLIPHVDWGEATDVSLFYGRTNELETLAQWIIYDRCRIVTLLGMGGIGKTSLSVKLAQQMLKAEEQVLESENKSQSSVFSTQHFDFIIWRSLRNSPPLEALLTELVRFLSNQQDTEPSLHRLLHWLRQSRCLVMLDNLETILQSEQQSGQYREGYEAYGELFRVIGETAHQSCFVLTSREKLIEIAMLEGMDLPVRSLLLQGSPEATIALIDSKGLFGTTQDQQRLGQFYGYNPLALKIVATSIQDLFDGDIAAFLSQGPTILNNIHRLLEQQCQRCTPIETTVMYWLAINREWTTVRELMADLEPKISRAELLEALESLRWRSLLEKQSGSYTQQPVVMEYVTQKFLEQICHEIIHGKITELTASIHNYALIKPQSSDYIQEIQHREILQPVLHELLTYCGNQTNLEHYLKNALKQLQENLPFQSSYAAGNLFNLLRHLTQTLTQIDFSRLVLWQVDLREVNLHKCNLAETDLSHAVLTETLSLPLAVAFSADGLLFTTGDATGEVKIWSVAEGKPLQTCVGHTDWVWSVAFSSDGNLLASGSSDRTIKLWDVQTGQCLHTLQGHECQVWSVAFHPHQSILASASEDQTIKLWNVQTGDCDRALQSHTAWVRSVAFSPNGQWLASGSDDGTVKLWDGATGICQQTLQGHADKVWSVAFSPDGRWLASSSSDRTIKLWHVETGTCQQTLQGHHNWVRSVAFSPDGQLLASGSEDQTIRLWQIETGKCQQTLQGHHNWVRSVAFSPDGQLLASGSGDHTVKLWQVATGRCRRTLQGYVNRVWSVASTENLLASAHDDHTIKLWDIHNHCNLKTLSGHTNVVCAVAFDAQGILLASGGEDHTVKLWNVQTGQCLQTLTGHTSRIWSVAFRSDGKLLASGSEDHTIKLWDIRTGACLRTLSGHTNWVCSVAFSDQYLASGSYDNTIKLWNSMTGDCLQTLDGHCNWVWSVAFDPTGTILASGSGDHTIKLWNVQTGQCLRTLAGHDSRVWSATFSPDGKMLASASSDRTIKLWDINTGKCLKTFAGHTNLAWSVAFSPDGQTIISGSQDETVRLWKFQTGDCLAILQAARPYEGTNILGVKGLTEAQRSTLLKLGAIEVQSTPQSSIPEFDRAEEMRDRLQQINASTKDLLNWAALLGMQFDPAQLADLTDCSLTALLTAIEELEQHQIIHPIELATGEVGYAFTQAEMPQWIKAQISAPRRRLMQRHIIQRFPNTLGTLA
jgi:WD40 repeat protein/DNA-binding SARP family transcriptional activator